MGRVKQGQKLVGAVFVVVDAKGQRSDNMAHDDARQLFERTRRNSFPGSRRVELLRVASWLRLDGRTEIEEQVVSTR